MWGRGKGREREGWVGWFDVRALNSRLQQQQQAASNAMRCKPGSMSEARVTLISQERLIFLFVTSYCQSVKLDESAVRRQCASCLRPLTPSSQRLLRQQTPSQPHTTHLQSNPTSPPSRMPCGFPISQHGACAVSCIVTCRPIQARPKYPWVFRVPASLP